MPYSVAIQLELNAYRGSWSEQNTYRFIGEANLTFFQSVDRQKSHVVSNVTQALLTDYRALPMAV